jgi:hypothetical protein
MPASAFHYDAVQVIFESDTGLPVDRVVHTFHFINAADTVWSGAQLDEIDLALESFYGTTQAGTTQELDTFMSSRLSGAMTIKHYDLHDAPPRAPIRTTIAPAIVPGADSLPTEVALCLSYQGQRVSGLPQSRRRGRVYIGPLSVSALVQATGLPNTAANGVIDTIAACGTFLAGATWSALGTVWGVYSPTDDQGVTVTDGWVDNAFDTQRRRGEKATTRQLWT